MLRATLCTGLAGLLAISLAGCGRGDVEYVQAVVARDASGPVLIVLDRWADGYTRLSSVDIASGTRGYPQVIGSDAQCIAASVGSIWCGYTAGETQFEHEQWEIGSWDVSANNAAIADHGGLTVEQIQINPGLAIRKTDHALALIGDSADTWTVDPVTLSQTPWPDLGSEDESAVTVPDAAQQGVRDYVDLGGRTYEINDDGLLASAPSGSTTYTVLNPTDFFAAGAFVVTDGFDEASPPVVPDGPESLLIVSPNRQDGSAGWDIARVGTADGKVIWSVSIPDAQWVDAVTSSGGVLAASCPTTAYTSTTPQPPRHGKILGFDLATGALRWTFSI